MDRAELFVFKSERCIMCGNEIPEGRQVCPKCEEAVFEGDAAAANDCGGKQKSQNCQHRLLFDIQGEKGNYGEGEKEAEMHDFVEWNDEIPLGYRRQAVRFAEAYPGHGSKIEQQQYSPQKGRLSRGTACHIVSCIFLPVQ